MTREQELESMVIKHRRAYYDGQPVITDAQYDALEEELRELNPEHPVLYLVGSEGGKVEHNPPMLSCQKAKTMEEVEIWAREKEIIMGYKIDGFSLSLNYYGGRLEQAATRGNGNTGDDVTLAAYFIRDIPKTIPVKERVNIRGEGYMCISEFNRLKAKYPEYSSPRNLATGSLKQKDPTILKERELHFMAFGIEGLNATLMDQIEILQKWGFVTADLGLTKNIQVSYDKIAEKRDELDFELDGVMFKYNRFEDREEAGSTSHHPKWQIALKFPSRGSITTINAITWQVGRTGVLTPVTELEPVEVAGARISRATLHNAEFLAEMNIATGDTVLVERSGDVIPKIIKVEEKGKNDYSFPNSCSCGASLRREGVNLLCTGENCEERDLASINHWIKNADIKGLGPKSIEKLYGKYIKHFIDLYDLGRQELVNMLGKNGEKIYDNLEKSRKMEFGTFLSGLGIPQLGNSMGRDLADKYSSIDDLRQASVSELIQLEGISDITAIFIVEGLKDVMIDKLLDKISIQYAQSKTKGDRGNVYVTGKIEGFNKTQIQQKVKDMGYTWSSSISGNLKFLVAGDKAGPKKLEKAEKLGIKVLSWDELLSMGDKEVQHASFEDYFYE
ncbi:MAG: NAD-dependent DNA ligase LigA [Candidatus Heimdallarchaeota archaeon]|nr:NAD-dependent DNA ligase LigA [Candidatus Heimdallarchaeota archaeon]